MTQQGPLSQWDLSPAEPQEPPVVTTKSHEIPVMSWKAHVPSFLVLKEDQKTVLILGPPGKGSAALEPGRPELGGMDRDLAVRHVHG